MPTSALARLRARLNTVAGGVVTSIAVASVSYALIVSSGLAQSAWTWWAVIGVVTSMVGVVVEVRSDQGSRLFGLGLALGAVALFGGLFLILVTLDRGLGSL